MTTHLGDGLILFRFFRPGVEGVNIAGSFNDWSLDATPMEPLEGGWWHLLLQMEPGEHQFRYLAGDDWFTDHAANGIERSRGTWNSMLVVPGQTLRRAA